MCIMGGNVVFLNVCIFLSLLVSINALPFNNTLRIVGGQSVDIIDYPYQVSVQFDGSHGCGGSILNKDYILTAAHCTYDITDVRQITVRAGSSYRNTGGTVYAVDQLYVHDNFNEDTYDFDISILHLSTPLNVGAGVSPVSLATSGTQIVSGMDSVATGWGLTSDQGQPSYQLQMVMLPTITTQDCRSIYYNDQVVTDRMFCAGYPNGGKDTCQGDSGGPLVVSGIQIGIVSWGQKCAAARSPGAYTLIPKFRDYIDKIAGT